MKEMRRRNWLVMILVLGWVILAFWYGTRPDNPINKIISPLTPTPTPDSRTKMGDVVQVDDLEVKVESAWRVVRPGPAADLGIVAVRFKGTSPCYDAESAVTCTFYRNNFRLANGQGKEQPTSDPPTKFIPGMKIIQLAPSRMLTPLTPETGQIYFLLDKESKEFILIYSSPVGDQQVRFVLQPKIYTNEDARVNLTTTPQPKYGEVEEE